MTQKSAHNYINKVRAKYFWQLDYEWTYKLLKCCRIHVRTTVMNLEMKLAAAILPLVIGLYGAGCRQRDSLLWYENHKSSFSLSVNRLEIPKRNLIFNRKELFCISFTTFLFVSELSLCREICSYVKKMKMKKLKTIGIHCVKKRTNSHCSWHWITFSEQYCGSELCVCLYLFAEALFIFSKVCCRGLIVELWAEGQ